LAAFLREGHLARHIRRMNAVYDRRRGVLADALAPLGEAFACGPMQVGLHVALMSKRAFDDRALSRALDGQRLVPLSSLCIERTDCYGFVLGFTNGSDEHIRAAADALSNALLTNLCRRRHTGSI